MSRRNKKEIDKAWSKIQEFSDSLVDVAGMVRDASLRRDLTELVALFFDDEGEDVMRDWRSINRELAYLLSLREDD